MECFSATCRNNLLPRLTSTQRDSQLLTTGYFSTFPPKPKGKCSHGGMLDSSRTMGAKGGINKDSTSPLFSPHHYLHAEAAKLASEDTLTVLRDLRDTVGHKTFLRLFSVKQAPALVFVIDTTGSMFEEITAARMRAYSIIQNRADLSGRPGSFLLVPFHDPEVGPVYETDDPNQFMEHMENLMALGGGDEPEMCLTAIQLALTHSPPLSEIFVFTDASPKDAHLFDVVKALALTKQSKVRQFVLSTPALVPGHSTTVDFNILNHGPDRLFSLTAEDDSGYLHTKGPHRFHVASDKPFHSQVGLHTPASAQAGATVTLTLSVYALDSADTNYAVAYLTVVPPDSDTSPPSCSATRLQSSCSPACNESTWSMSLAVSDSGLSGLAALQLHKGQGTLTLFPPVTGGKLGEAHLDQRVQHKVTLVEREAPLNVSRWELGSSEPLWVNYTSSCCSVQAELLVWDTAGNMKRCHLASSQQRQLSEALMG
ncbi:von Willebrand factor A domain-containing protein 7-like [Hippocampus comes]|uniref:von Willebrand factor A domain-containing protein 7-like n=1 Tax=Hippocampus comes TaxID=109280 RepID=UPI00094E04AA|nr:PREDICTED: von Willebrand factor A domain-containing protein 7-like [Hippocampus comes]